LRNIFLIGLSAASIVVLAACAPANKDILPNETTHERVPTADEASNPPAPVPPMVAPATGAAAEAVLARYAYVDPGHIVPTGMLKKTILYFDANLASIRNQKYITVVDFSKPSNLARFFVVNMSTGIATAIWVAHGSGSDPHSTGTAQYFSNTEGSEMSSLGFFLTNETYSGSHPGVSLRIDGLSTTNSNVRSRDIVIHGADYVKNQDIKQGMSWGCFALDMAVHDAIATELKDGSLIYSGLSADDGL
jgi:hypothetical protein